jgi:hypothetical protein
MNKSKHGKPPRRPWLFAGLAIMLLAAAGELLASWFFARYGQRLALPDPERFTASPEEVARISGVVRR